MFITKKWLKKLIKPVDESGKLKTEIEQLKKELAELKLKKVMEEREIKHLVTLKEEKLEIEHEKHEVELQKQYQQKEMTLQTQYHDKIMAALNKAADDMNATYKEIMKRLPNVNVELKGKR
ncbi:hypothetical protein LCGC14_0704090 [marine sediment metagenome]|uniref:Uncharacterized protein n=1 Tax=marine sediment metagenome TaxID=412755 RepID=A0A0F9R2F5_9ZZZZ